MAKTRLLQSVCAVVMLTAAAVFAHTPAFAQTNTPPADTGAGGALNNPTAVPNGTPADQMGSMKGTGSHASMDHHSTRHSAAHAAHMRGHAGASQDAAVDRLNDQSYQAAHTGQAFTAPAR